MEVWQILSGNLATVALVMSVWMHIEYKFYRLSPIELQLGFGAAMGLGAIASMLLSVQLVQGVHFDLRVSLVALSALYGGPVALLVTGLAAIITRIIIGGVGANNGIEVILIASVVGLILHYLNGKRAITAVSICINALAIGLLSLGTMLLMPPPGTASIMPTIAPPMALLNLAAAVVTGFVLAYFREFTLERDILHAALTQAPDFHYVKNMRSQFVVTNLKVAQHAGRKKSSEMIGLTDFDIDTPERASALFNQEQALMANGGAITDVEERTVSDDGQETWYLTSKVALRNRQGEMVGLSGVTRDITERKKLENDVTKNRNLLMQAMAEMSDGLAMFDVDGHLVFCNDQYREAFPLSAYARQPGAHISDIIRASVRNGERKFLPTSVSEEWIQSTSRELMTERDVELQLFNDRWLSVRTRMANDGSALVVVSDITAMKLSEQSLKDLAEQMKGLAETDALTSIANRRVFDQTIAAECSRSNRDGAPLSLLLIDIDRFKKYNDTYGHLAGDDCLKGVGKALSSVARRPGDIVARYGGEEFALLLPHTDQDSAVVVAEAFRLALSGMGMLHEASEFGVVTASIGIATTGGGHPARDPAGLIAAADGALYRAKTEGRNRVAAGIEGDTDADRNQPNSVVG